ncbi:methanogenesis marker protein 11 [Methanothermobacter sp.]|uniref:methanogenesis marker protein 11 n=1 Tax=Methanothermobacter sp. TaxID=1884223 RepID=UPI003C7584CA
MEILRPSDLKERFRDPWISPYTKVLTMVDGDLVEILEYHPCISGSEWMIYQYSRSSKLIERARRDGNRHTYLVHTGKAPIELRASLNAAGIEEVAVEGDEVRVVHAGLAGAGVGAAMCRGMAEGVKRVELYEAGGGSKPGRAAVITPRLEKVVLGIDDTDTPESGATWTLANNMGMELSRMGFEYIDHVTVQLYPHNPRKTQNCVSVALAFAVQPGKSNELVNLAAGFLEENTLSDKTSIAVFRGIKVPKELKDYSMMAKKSFMEVEDAENVAESLGIDLIEVTGSQGKIGALAAIGLYDDPEEAARVYY